MTELFPTEEMEVPSPRLAWIKQHGITVRRNPKIDEDLGQWECWSGNYEEASDKQMSDCPDLDGPFFVAEQSEEAALVQYAISNNIRLWNEG
jgi:hypothetical protein